MKRECVQKFLSGFFVFCITLSFSFAVFSAPYTGAYLYTGTDPVTGLPIVEVRGVNPTGQTFSGSNVIEMNAYNNAPILTNNTFNGTTSIDPAFTDIESNGNTYNGTTTLTYDGITGGQLESNNDTFATANVTATNAGVEMNNPTFNGSMTLQADNISLGSIDQMDTLISETQTTNSRLNTINTTINNLITRIAAPIAILYDNITTPYYSTSSNQRTFSIGGQSYTYTLSTMSLNSVNHYFNFAGRIVYHLNLIAFNISTRFIRATTSDTDSFLLHSYNNYPVTVHKSDYYVYSYDASNDVISSTTSYAYTNFYGMWYNYFHHSVFSYINSNILYLADTWYRWYSPRVTPSSNYFWYVYNTDTAQQESINLGGLLYDISWYLGQMYVLQSASQSLDNMADQVEDITDTLEEAEQKENAIISSISSGINSFAPDIQSISAFRALSWCSNYLQQMFVALGVYGTVIMVGLLLGVCMQFIGYFRYK